MVGRTLPSELLVEYVLNYANPETTSTPFRHSSEPLYFCVRRNLDRCSAFIRKGDYW